MNKCKHSSWIDLTYIFSLFIDYIRGRKRLKPMSNMKLVEFEDLNNIHIFKKQSNISECGHIKKSEHTEIESTALMDLKELRSECALQANAGFDICGLCVSTLFSSDDH